jgi:hypothetical protein
MKHAALGFRVHSGWTALVAVAVTKGSPFALARERPHLVEAFTYEFRQPYHTAKKMSCDEARAFISGVQKEARRLAFHAIRGLQANLLAQGFQLVRCGLLLASGRPLPGLSQVLASHALIHTADGELFREAILHASSRCGVEAMKVKEKDLLSSASQALHMKARDIQSRVKDLGRPVGSPWSQDEKFASLVAWLALASRSSARTGSAEAAR